MKRIIYALLGIVVFWFGSMLCVPLVVAKDGQVVISRLGTNFQLQIQGSGNEDWRLETSGSFATWSSVGGFGTLLSGGTNAPWRTVGTLNGPIGFFRASKTAGLYDPTLLRTISLTFTQANWSNAMVSARTYSTNVYCNILAMDNGATNFGVGARFRGNTSFTGMGVGGAPAKKSLSLSVDFANTNADLMGFNSLNLNNAYGDETIMRESLYFGVMRQYAVCPAAAMAQLYINGGYRGVYSLVEQENGDLIKEYFPSTDGDRWRAPNMDANGALVYLNNSTNQSTYQNLYELKSDFNTNAWRRLINAIYVLNNTSSNLMRDKVDAVLAVDRWLWFLAIENIFADDDSYWNKGSDYMIYYEPESGRLHPVEHDGNEAFTAQDVNTSPLSGNTTRPVLKQLLSIPEWNQRYFAHMRTVLQESYNPGMMTALINRFHALSITNIIADSYKGYTTLSTYTNDLSSLKLFVTNRYKYLSTYADIAAQPPTIVSVSAPTADPTAAQAPFVTANVLATGTNGVSSVWLYHRGKSYGRFASVQMLDDGAHGDGAANDGIFGAATTNYASGTNVRFYVEARSANPTKAASFAPARAEESTYNYHVAITTAPSSPVVINEVLASNEGSGADPQGDYDDWIELRNLTASEVDLTGRYLSDESGNMRKWQFPAGTKIPADGYLVVWADEDGSATAGLHASFKLSGSGEQLYLTDTDANLNAVLDYVSFGVQTSDVSYGRSPDDADTWIFMKPTPGLENK